MRLPKKILVVDDDKAILEAVSFLLREAGFSVCTRENGIGLEQSINQHAHSLLLLDLWLPGFDGSELTKRLKANPKTRHIPIILFSASTEVARIAEEVGADGYINKPFEADELIALIKTHA